MALPTAFTGNISPTGEELDADLAALGALTPIPCTLSGTNTLALTPLANTPTVVALANYMQFTAVVGATNTTTVTIAVGSFAGLNLYKDTVAGPVLLTGGELVAGTKLIVMYDAALNTGTGGFHLIGQAASATRDRNTLASIAFGALSPQTGTTATVALAGTSIGDVVSIGLPSLSSISLVWTGYIPNAGTVTMQVFNASTVTTVTPPPGNYTVATRGFT